MKFKDALDQLPVEKKARRLKVIWPLIAPSPPLAIEPRSDTARGPLLAEAVEIEVRLTR